VVPTSCASGDARAIRDHITKVASHEIVEAATDPLVGTGWMNNIVTDVDDNFASRLIDQLSNTDLDLKAGEVGDICEESGHRGPPAFSSRRLPPFPSAIRRWTTGSWSPPIGPTRMPWRT
jgi:hypothetical protein